MRFPRGRGNHQQLQLHAVTYNTSCWKRAKKYLQDTLANVVVFQEVRLYSFDEESAWARRQGWKSIWTPAFKASTGPSCGVASFVRDWMGLRCLPGSQEHWPKGRMAAGVVECPDHPELVVIGGYLATGSDKEAADVNADILAACAAALRGGSVPGLVAADFNRTPAQLQALGLRSLGLVLAYPDLELGTCKGAAQGPRVIDYFLTSGGLNCVVQSCSVDPEDPLVPHRPVHLKLQPKVLKARMLVFEDIPIIPVTRPPQPRRRPRQWQGQLSQAHQVADMAFEALQRAGPHAGRVVQEAVDELYALWAEAAEAELFDLHDMGSQPGKGSLRASCRRLVWVPVVPAAKSRVVFQAKDRPWLWLRDQLDIVAADSKLAARRTVAAKETLVSNQPEFVKRAIPDSVLQQVQHAARFLPADSEEEQHIAEAHLQDVMAVVSQGAVQARKQDDEESHTAWRQWGGRGSREGGEQGAPIHEAPEGVGSHRDGDRRRKGDGGPQGSASSAGGQLGSSLAGGQA